MPSNSAVRGISPRVTILRAWSAVAMLGVILLAHPVWGQSGPTLKSQRVAENMSRVLLWCGVLLGSAILLAVVFLLIRKRLSSLDAESPKMVNSMGFTLVDLREMHTSGQLNDEEFALAKRKMQARARAQLDAPTTEQEPQFDDLGDLTNAPAAGSGPAVASSPSASPSASPSVDPPQADKPADLEADPDKIDNPEEPPPDRPESI